MLFYSRKKAFEIWKYQIVNQKIIISDSNAYVMLAITDVIEEFTNSIGGEIRWVRQIITRNDSR